MAELVVGEKAPNFVLLGDDSQLYTLYDQKSPYTLLFFYPKDMTPGCTTESCDFNDAFADFSRLGVNIFGISRDDLSSHNRFKGKYGLKFTLLSDPDLTIHKAYEAYGEKTSYGKTSLGVIRTTFLLDRNKMIVKVWRKVRVKGHAKTVFDAMAKLEPKAKMYTGAISL